MGAHPSLPSAAGPVAEQMNRVAGKLADYMRQNLEDLFKDLSQQGSPEATIKGLQLELEKMQWRPPSVPSLPSHQEHSFWKWRGCHSHGFHFARALY